MNITKKTKLAELVSECPWLKDEIAKVNEKFKMFHSPLGKVMAKKATIADMSEKSGMDAERIIEKLTELIGLHK